MGAANGGRGAGGWRDEAAAISAAEAEFAAPGANVGRMMDGGIALACVITIAAGMFMAQ